MGLKKLIQTYKDCWHARKDRYIDWKIEFLVDDHDYLLSLFPTIMWQPFMYRYPNTPVIDITWLHFHIFIGVWRNKEE